MGFLPEESPSSYTSTEFESSSGRQNALRVFDLDHTLMKENTSYLFGWFLYKKGFFSSYRLLRSLSNYMLYKCGILGIPKLHEKVFAAIFYGKSLRLIKKYLEEFLSDEFFTLLEPKVLQRLEIAKFNQEYTAILSSSPDFLVKPIAEKLGVPFWVASHYIPDAHGILCDVKVFSGKDKVHALQKLQEDLSIHSSQVTVFSDSIYDLPLLRSAGNAVVVRPNLFLKRLALGYGWEII